MKPLTAQLTFPFKGLSDRMGYALQPGQTTVSCQNVRGYEALTGRLRGGTRPGHSKYLSSQLNSSNAIQLMMQVAVSSAVSGASVRTLYNLGVAGGNVYSFTSSAGTLATSGTAALSSSSPFVFGAELFGVVYFADGANYQKWTASTNTCAAWSASTAGTVPANGSNKPRLICKWRNRIVLAGIVGDAQNWFMSAAGDALDFDYTVETVTAAVAGNNSDAGLNPDIINALIPFSDDLLIFGGDHTIYQMSNDPADGGQIDLLTDTTGIAFGQAWCRDPSGFVYFWGSRGGLWMLAPDQPPVRLSDPVEERMAAIDLSANTVRLAWDDRTQSVMVYITPTADSAGQHWCYDVRQKAWWLDVFGSNGHQPRSVLVLDGDATGDRCVLLGCRDGYIRKVDYTAEGDDGTAISSFVYLGPIHTKDWGAFRLGELGLTFGGSSSTVTVTGHVGGTAEDAKAASASFTETFTSSTRGVARPRCAGTALYLKYATNTLGESWQYEDGYCVLFPLGRVATRLV